jgi:Protein of unknown function (DUF2946)
MTAQRTDSPMRALGLAVALFAITFNFLQPLAHAAMMRGGSPETLWTVFCNSTTANPDGRPGEAPMPSGMHDCCLGLAQAPVLALPPVVFAAIAPVSTFIAPLIAAEQPTPVGIRDGPTQPRGPPSFADR